MDDERQNSGSTKPALDDTAPSAVPPGAGMAKDATTVPVPTPASQPLEYDAPTQEMPPRDATLPLDYPVHPAYPTAPGRQPSPPGESALARPFPPLLNIAVPVAAVAVVLVGYLLRVLTGGDWADGVGTVAALAFVLAIGAAAVAGMRYVLGRQGQRFVPLSALLVGSLLVTGIASVIAVSPLHLAQAHAEENAGRWSAAIHEYQLGGEYRSTSSDLARVYDAWGEALLRQKNYAAAEEKFLMVLTRYRDTGALADRARAGRYHVYAQWLRAAPDAVPGQKALDALQTYQRNRGCGSDCQADITALLPQAHYRYGEELLAASKYSDAIAQFDLIAGQYPRSAVANEAHAAAATAYYGLGQRLLAASFCTDAVPVYKTLSATYGDTPEGKKARAELAAPRDVSGRVTGLSNPSSATIHLSTRINPDTYSYSNEYSAKLDKSGNYTIKNVKQGKYYISLTRPLGGTTEYAYWWADAKRTAYYSITVEPLCSVSVAELAY